MYQAFRYLCKGAVFPFVLVVWLAMTPVVVVTSLAQDETFDAFLKDLRLWANTLSAFFH